MKPIDELPPKWKLMTIQEIGEVILSNVDKKNSLDEKTVRLCNYTDVYHNNYIDGTITFMEATASDKEIEKFSLKKGDVIITKDSETADDIAVSTFVVEDLPDVLCGYHLAIIRPYEGKASGMYLSKLFDLHTIRHYFSKLANGVTRFGLTADSIKSALIPLPPIQDQQKIAQVLTTWDNAIIDMGSFIVEKTEQKRGLMQQLLTEKTRFPEFEGEEWKKTKLSDFFTEFSVKNNDNEQLPVMSCSKIYGIIKQADRFNKRIASKDIRRYKIIERDDLVYDPMLLWDASIGFVKSVDKGVISPAYSTFKFNNNGVRNFFEYYIYTHYMRHEYKVISKGTNVRRRKASASDFLRIKVTVPPTKNEQQKITSVLTTADHEITLLKKQLEALKLQKKGLMQKLLTGEVRVNA